MSVLQTVLALAVVPVAVYAVVTLIVLWPKLARPRRRRGDGWDFAPVFWVADPARVNAAGPVTDVESELGPDEQQPSTARGGARGTW
ncbi:MULTISPECIES: aa3-type cytochrome oxidase subunit CtaJ [Saccharopolyspora]|uniref:Uncharacterized protein n=1 Tax=Saccharopolyspora cebuensis TaxID=418759 RepID=A0ABV4CGL1_9PSEU